MEPTNNIIVCKKCRAPLIFEELDIHECFTKTLVDFRHNKETNEYYVFDGKNGIDGFLIYQRKINNGNQTLMNQQNQKL